MHSGIFRINAISRAHPTLLVGSLLLISLTLPILFFPKSWWSHSCAVLLKFSFKTYKKDALATWNITLKYIRATYLPPMRFVLLSALLFGATTWAQSASVSSFLATESPIAKANLLANIGGSGSTKVTGVKVLFCRIFWEILLIFSLDFHQTGVVIASPSQSSPDYFYTWTRDSSLVFKAIIDQ